MSLATEERAFFSQPLIFHAELTDYPQIAFDHPFNVTLSSAGFACLSNQESLFITGDPSMTFGIMFSNNTFVKDIALTQIANPVAKNSDSQDISLPSFITFNPKSL